MATEGGADETVGRIVRALSAVDEVEALELLASLGTLRVEPRARSTDGRTPLPVVRSAPSEADFTSEVEWV